jgi:hypothetical protein
MKNNEPKEDQAKQETAEPKRCYRQPELKKHGKLKSTASQTVVVYTTYYVW